MQHVDEAGLPLVPHNHGHGPARVDDQDFWIEAQQLCVAPHAASQRLRQPPRPAWQGGLCHRRRHDEDSCSNVAENDSSNVAENDSANYEKWMTS